MNTIKEYDFPLSEPSVMVENIEQSLKGNDLQRAEFQRPCSEIKDAVDWLQ